MMVSCGKVNEYEDKHGVLYLVDENAVEHNFVVYGYSCRVMLPTRQKIKR